MKNGYWQKILKVNLTNRNISTEEIEEDDLKSFIGGAGYGGEILRRQIAPRKDAYDPDNPIIFATGPFQGPPVAGGAKFSIIGKSPITQTFADTAAGGNWGPAIKDAGYDFLVVEGKSESPVYLCIVDDQIQIKDASHLWGKNSLETVDLIKDETNDKKLSIATIGPAGEKKVAIACVAVDKHSFAGRCGMGAVMGSKGLKAVAVRGTQKALLNDQDRTMELIHEHTRQILETVKENGFRAHGTPSICETAESLGDMPIKYWEGDTWPEGAKRLGAPNSTEVLNAKPLFCKFCPIGCHRKIKIVEPKAYAQEGVGPQYETLGMMGTNLLIDDPKVVAQANKITNQLGMDTISAGAMVGFAIECFQKRLIGTKETDGLELKWGDPNTLFTLVMQIGNKQGFGALFSDGTLKAAEKIGKEAVNAVAHCKGLDLPAHDPRACISLAPTYATGTRGACHYRGGSGDVEMGFYIPEIGIEEGTVKFFETKNQSKIAIKCQDYFTLLNSMVLCAFMPCGGEMPFSGIKDIFNAITGWDYSIDDLMLTGERSFTVQRLINNHDGFDAKTDVLPNKMFQVAEKGFRAGKHLLFNELMQDYYQQRGWDTEGRPGDEVLSRLELK